MTAKQTVALGVRLFSIWLAVFLVRDAPAWWLINTSDFQSTPGAIAAVTVATCVIAIIAVLLWLFPLTVARKLLPRAALDQTITPAPAEQIERAGFCLLGLWLLTQALPSLLFEAIVFYQYTRLNSTFGLRPQEYATLAEALAELGIAIWLLFGAKGLLGIIGWARAAGSGAAVRDTPERDP